MGSSCIGLPHEATIQHLPSCTVCTVKSPNVDSGRMIWWWNQKHVSYGRRSAHAKRKKHSIPSSSGWAFRPCRFVKIYRWVDLLAIPSNLRHQKLGCNKTTRLANQQVHVKQHGHFFFHHQQLVMAKLYWQFVPTQNPQNSERYPK